MIQTYTGKSIDHNKINRAYRMACELSPYGTKGGFKLHPTIESIYEEYVTDLLEEKMIKTEDEIAKELTRLKRMNALSIEEGLQATQYDAISIGEMLNFLIENSYVFYLEDHLYNSHLQGVW